MLIPNIIMPHVTRTFTTLFYYLHSSNKGMNKYLFMLAVTSFTVQGITICKACV